MEKKHIIIIAVLVVIIAILAVTVLSMGNGVNLQKNNNGTIKISSDDNSVSGKLTIHEYKNIKKNPNGTYNITQFYDKFGTPKGIKNDIPIKNGKAEYTLHNDTEFFIVDSITKVKSNDTGNTSTPTINVEYLYNGKSILSSSEPVNFYPEVSEKDCLVSFALDIYSLDGNKLSIDSFNIDIPELKDNL